MSGLILKLKPNEEVLINGVVVQNGERKTRLRVKTSGAAILRLRDAIRPEDATTPEARAYYIAQLAVTGEIEEAKAGDILTEALSFLERKYGEGPVAEIVSAAKEELKNQRYYGVMRRLAELVRPRVAPRAAAS